VKPIIDITGLSTPEAAAAALPALASRAVYQRAGALVHIVHEPVRREDQIVAAGAPRIRELPRQLLENELHEGATYRQSTTRGESAIVQLPSDVVRTVAEAGQWHHVLPIRGVANWPVLAPDGDDRYSLIVRNGYNPQTAYVLSGVPTIQLPDKPTQADAQAAARLLLGLVDEFPITTGAGRAAWLAGVLTLIARPAIRGPVPAIIFDAPTPGTGKTLLAELIGRIVLGYEPFVRAAPTEASEWHRALLGMIAGGEPIILLDNIRGHFESGAFEAVLTSSRFSDRKLRTNEEVTFDVRALFLLTGNNATITRDLVRRSLHCRLVPGADRPELRGDFKIHDLKAHVRANRTKLLEAALTILWAYGYNELPPVPMRHLGGYEEWSKLVRASLIWAGCDDPATTQDALLEMVSDSGEVSELLEAMHAHYGDRAVTTRDMLDDLKEADAEDATAIRLRRAIDGALEGAGSKSPVRVLGGRLRKLRDAIHGGFRLVAVPPKTNAGERWRVDRIDPEPAQAAAE
jgi:hypothetical protein